MKIGVHIMEGDVKIGVHNIMEGDVKIGFHIMEQYVKSFADLLHHYGSHLQ